MLPHIPKNLVKLTLFDGEVEYWEWTTSDAGRVIKEKQRFKTIDGDIIHSSLVAKADIASGLDEFRVFILPRLPADEQKDFLSISESMISKKTSLEVVLRKMKEKKQERSYYNAMRRKIDEEERRRRREQVERMNHRMKKIFIS